MIKKNQINKEKNLHDEVGFILGTYALPFDVEKSSNKIKLFMIRSPCRLEII